MDIMTRRAKFDTFVLRPFFISNHAVPNVHYVLLLIVMVMLLATCSYLADGCCQPPVGGVPQASQSFEE